MQGHHEPWLTALFNNYLPGIGNWFLSLVRLPAQERPWSTAIATEIFVVILLMALFALVRSRLSMDRPGKLQHIVEAAYNFFHDQSEDQIGHHGHKYVPLFGAIFFFVLACNLIGIVPTMEAPTMFPEVPAGIAILAFLYYHLTGIRANGLGKYLAHFAGPMPVLAPLMIPIEMISHCARPLSLTIRLFANMYAGEMVTLVFLQLTFLAVPALFMGLHVFVSFLQAYIFMLMTMMYVSGATAHDH
jgi:F-type H+-transporting ATPase subunit a